ncbi:hypothetical protein JCGZ_11957 [Jatropha curcas]|uniref:Uncharacterized protein n=1 Tax=Jatropha curcas TaxID=180498 RepID=A0A067KS49_JATCU|nr:hypothetical protein JCGZ_11957 [Jatropha curcas]
MWYNHRPTKGHQQESPHTPPPGPPGSYPPASTCAEEEHGALTAVPWPPGAHRLSPPGSTGQASTLAVRALTEYRTLLPHERDRSSRRLPPRESEEAAKQESQ